MKRRQKPRPSKQRPIRQSRSEEPRRLLEDYAKELREIIKKLKRIFN
jgi:hypothetical protein